MTDNRLSILIGILRNSNELDKILASDEVTTDLLEQAGATQVDEESWTLDSAARVSLAIQANLLGAELEEIVNLLSWKDFEGLVARILTENDYRCLENFRKRGTKEARGMEIDVIGVKGTSVISVDAKMWGVRSGKSTALKSAAEKQEERTVRLCDQMHMLAEKLGGIPSGVYSLTPVLVTWMVEEVVFHDGVPVVPVFKLNTFLQDMPIYQDMIASSDCVFHS
ncbi:MAG: hypothetical protein ACE5H4_06455 [Candidatus Thorarchaeota archaeon]